MSDVRHPTAFDSILSNAVIHSIGQTKITRNSVTLWAYHNNANDYFKQEPCYRREDRAMPL